MKKTKSKVTRSNIKIHFPAKKHKLLKPIHIVKGLNIAVITELAKKINKHF